MAMLISVVSVFSDATCFETSGKQTVAWVFSSYQDFTAADLRCHVMAVKSISILQPNAVCISILLGIIESILVSK